jgi:hypothetical protein
MAVKGQIAMTACRQRSMKGYDTKTEDISGYAGAEMRRLGLGRSWVLPCMAESGAGSGEVTPRLRLRKEPRKGTHVQGAFFSRF